MSRAPWIIPALFAVTVSAAARADDAASSTPADTATAELDDDADSAAEKTTPASDDGLSVAAVPTLAFNSDEGFGTGGVATLFHRADGVLPYKNAWNLRLFISTKLVQAHRLSWDAVEPFGLPLRTWARVGFYSTLTQNFCGYGNAVRCDPAEATQAAGAAGLAAGSEEHEAFERHYYAMRFLRFYGDALGRWRLRDRPHRVEAVLGWRGNYYLPGEFTEFGPYPGSLYAQTFADGELGFSSQLFGGLVVDDRDHETFPTRGYYAELTARGAAPWTGSQWSYGGGTAILAGFWSVLPRPRVVLAARLLADGLYGDPPTEELARVGGLDDAIAFGGHAIGRGVREHRFLGKLKLIHQLELRGQFWDFTLLEQDLSFGAATFYDLALLGYDIEDLRGEPTTLLAGAGLSGRFIWNRDFTVRVDVAFSPIENYTPGIYIIVGNVF